MTHSSRRILTTHCGSLPRPKDLLDARKSKARGEAYDAAAYEARVRSAVAESVTQQVSSGIDVPNDGEQGKIGFYMYVQERLSGFEAMPRSSEMPFAKETSDFPEYYAEYLGKAMLGGAVVPVTRLRCIGPVAYRGQEAIRRDIENLKAALAGQAHADVFLPAVAPSGVGGNAYYESEEEYLFAVADALREEYQAIVAAGFLVQVDDPFLTELYSYSRLNDAEKRRQGEMYVAAVNHSLRGIPPEKIRFHTCYGINEGPRIHDVPLAGIIDLVLKVNAGAYSFEAANPRHEHEYHLWERVKLPEGKALIPGVITHASNIVEHPELIAERIVRLAKLVGRENVIAGADCGFSSMATYHTEVHPKVIWAKFRAMAEGAALATQALWA